MDRKHKLGTAALLCKPPSLFAFLLQVHAASSHFVPVWLGLTLSCLAILAMSMGCLRISAMAMAGPCSVPGEAWDLLFWLDSSAHWPPRSMPLVLLYRNPDMKMELCDLRVQEKTLQQIQPR